MIKIFVVICTVIFCCFNSYGGTLFSGLTLKDSSDGVVVHEIKPSFPAKEAGLKKDDLILEIDGHDITTVDDFIKISTKISAKAVKLGISRPRTGKNNIFDIYTLRESPKAVQQPEKKNDVLPKDEFVKITSRKCKVFASPDSSSFLITKAKKGDVFKFSENHGKWYEIYMFAGEPRYIKKSKAKLIYGYNKNESLPVDINTRFKMYNEMFRLEDKAERDAELKHPYIEHYVLVSDERLRVFIEYMRMLQDQYKMELFHKFKVQPPAEAAIGIEAEQYIIHPESRTPELSKNLSYILK